MYVVVLWWTSVRHDDWLTGCDFFSFFLKDSNPRIQCCCSDVQGTAWFGREERGRSRAVTTER
jgi:hypothetical protein